MTSSHVKLARELDDSLTALDLAVRGIRSDEPALDVTIPAPRRDVDFALPDRTRTVDELWVRIFPDDIAVETHEERLTASERESGRTFWRETSRSGDDDTLRRGAWRALCQRYGSRRAAWIAEQTRPRQVVRVMEAEAGAEVLRTLKTLDRRIDEVAASEPGERLAALVRAADAVVDSQRGVLMVPAGMLPMIRRRAEVARAKLTGLDVRARGRVEPGELSAARRTMLLRLRRIERWIDEVDERIAQRGDVADDLAFADLPVKDGGWTRAPHSGVLPARFVVITVSGDRVSHVVAGEPVPRDLKLGPDPDPANRVAERFSLDADGNLVVGASIRWMVDYDEAARKGMAVTIPISAEEARAGFNRVYVLGVQTAGVEEGRGRLEALLDNHHYGESGLALLPIGTPTNNTEQQESGYKSTDDPDESYRIEQGAPLFDAAAADPADGLRLARALGIEPARLAHVARADGRDVAEALLMNAVLWPATLGNFLVEFFGSLMPIDTRDRIAAYALAHVTARGLLPSLRVGRQPYGVLPATAFSRYVPTTGEAQLNRAPRTEAERQALFNRLLRDVLLRMHEDWSALRSAHVKHAHTPGVIEFQQHFLEMLGLEATSVSCEYRFSLNCARRHPPSSGDDLLLDFGVPRSADRASRPRTSADYGPVALLDRFAAVFRDALQLPPGPVLGGGQVGDAFDKAYRRLRHTRAYDVRHLRAPKPLRGEVVGPDAATWIPALLDAAPRRLAEEARAGGDSRPLLYLLLRQALLIQMREAALRILAMEGMLTEEARRLAGSSDVFLVSTLSEDYAVTQWNYLFAPLSELDGRFDIVFPAGAGTLFTYLRAGALERPMDAYLSARGDNDLFRGFPGRGRHAPFVQALVEHADSAARLAEIPAARLEQLCFEHLDLVSHRLDAWIAGLAAQRLAEMRDRAPLGVCLGAYGWVEDLRPDVGHPLATDVPPALVGDGRGSIHADPENQGFIHAPSLNHAVAAAILRSGYLSEARQADVDNRLAVNLSSRRVRVALDLIESVRSGNDLGALLGYHFERFLHEAYATEGITLDDLIAPLRRAFPATVSVDAALSSPETARRLVVDGLALVQTVQTWVGDHASGHATGATLFEILHDAGRYTGYPFGIHGAAGEAVLPPITDATGRRRLDGLLRALDQIADALDAVGDLVVSEGVYQIAQGNHARAAAALSALSEGKAPPRPEIVDTPRTGTAVSQRLFLQLPPIDGRAVALPPLWANLPATPRANAEPSLNRWLGELLGAPQDIRARLVTPDGVQAAEVSAADLGLQAIDLLMILGRGLEEGLGELAARLIDARRPADVDDENPPAARRVDLERDAAWGAGVKSFLEVAPFLEAAWDLVTRGRPATAHDWLLEETSSDGGAMTSGSDLIELEARVRTGLAALRAVGVRLIELISGGADNDPALLSGDPRVYLAAKADVHRSTIDGQTVLADLDRLWRDRNDFRAVLLRAAAFGIPQADPPASFPSRKVVAGELLDKVEAAFIEAATRVQRADAVLAALASAARPAEALLAAAKAIFGESFPVLPHFRLRNGAEIARALAARLAPADDPSLDGWIHGVAVVRERPARLARVLVLADAFGAQAPVAQPLQLPHRAGDPWLGADLPARFRPTPDRLSLVAFGADALDTAGGANVGILIDHWIEVVPSPDETTGVAVHYDQPDAMPPQCLLLAVPPAIRGAWRWEDLVVTLDDTFELAKNRAVELEHLHHDLYGQILPGVMGELVPEALRATATEVPGSRVILDFGQNDPPPRPAPA